MTLNLLLLLVAILYYLNLYLHWQKFPDNSRKKSKLQSEPIIEAKPELKEISPASFFGGCKVLKKEQRIPKRKASNEHQKIPEEVNFLPIFIIMGVLCAVAYTNSLNIDFASFQQSTHPIILGCLFNSSHQSQTVSASLKIDKAAALLRSCSGSLTWDLLWSVMCFENVSDTTFFESNMRFVLTLLAHAPTTSCLRESHIVRMNTRLQSTHY